MNTFWEKKGKCRKVGFNCVSTGRVETTDISRCGQVTEVTVRVIKYQTDVDLPKITGFWKIIIFSNFKMPGKMSLEC